MSEASRAAAIWKQVTKDPNHLRLGLEIFDAYDLGELCNRRSEPEELASPGRVSLTTTSAKLLEKLAAFIEAYESKIQPDGQGSAMRDELLADIQDELQSRNWLN